jgi:hypothetical protein
MYHALGLLQRTSDFDLDAAGARLVARIPGSSASRSGNTVTVSKGDWWIAMALEAGDHLRDEIEGLTSRLAGVEGAEAEEYVASARRVTLWTDVSDPFMEHFNDYLFAIEVLKSFGGVLAVDPKEPGVL